MVYSYQQYMVTNYTQYKVYLYFKHLRYIYNKYASIHCTSSRIYDFPVHLNINLETVNLQVETPNICFVQLKVKTNISEDPLHIENCNNAPEKVIKHFTI